MLYCRFGITKLGSAVLCGAFIWKTVGLKHQADEYLDALNYNHLPEEMAVGCDHRVGVAVIG